MSFEVVNETFWLFNVIKYAKQIEILLLSVCCCHQRLLLLSLCEREIKKLHLKIVSSQFMVARLIFSPPFFGCQILSIALNKFLIKSVIKINHILVIIMDEIHKK